MGSEDNVLVDAHGSDHRSNIRRKRRAIIRCDFPRAIGVRLPRDANSIYRVGNEINHCHRGIILPHTDGRVKARCAVEDAPDEIA